MASTQTLGTRIKAERTEKGLTQRQLAKMAKLPEKGGQQALQQLEQRGSKRSTHAAAFAKALGLSLTWALTGKGPKYEKDRIAVEKAKAEREAKHAILLSSEESASLANLEDLIKWIRGHAQAASPHGQQELAIILSPTGPLVVDTTVKSVEEEAVYSFKLNGVPYIKKVERRPDKTTWVTLGGSQPLYQIQATDQLEVEGRAVLALEATKVFDGRA